MGGVTAARILVIEDSDAIRAPVVTALGAQGFIVRGAEDGRDLETLLGSYGPDLVILDVMLPGRDGFEVMKSLREDPELASVPILVVSAGGEERRAIGAGARSYLSKPVDADGLVSAVRCLLGSEVGSVLIVEDNPDTTELLASTLVENGLTVRTAANGREGLDRLAEGVPSAIILDLMMPVMDGWTFCEEKQKDPVLAPIPLVVLSAVAPQDPRNASVRAVGHIPKPIDVEKLLAAVESNC